MPIPVASEIEEVSLGAITVDYQLRPLSKNCAGSGLPLTGGSDCWSVVVEEDGKLVRHDYSDQAWEGPPENSVGFWKSEVPASIGNEKPKLDPDSLFDYFVQLSDSPNTAEQDFLYVLSLLLLRKKRLILEETITVDDQPAMKLIGHGGEGPFEVVERSLTDDQIADLQQQLFGGSAAA